MATPTQSRVTVTSSPTRLATSAGAASISFIVRNLDTSLSIWVGNSAVTTSDGLEVKAGEILSGELGAGSNDTQELYGISASSVSTAVVSRVAAP